jgi:STE24 endopeptidase
MLEEFSTDEIETVLAHELAHHVHMDIPTGIALESLLTMLGLYLASLGLNWGVVVFGFSGPSDVAAIPLFILVMSVFGLVIMPLTNAFSRWRERRADFYALEATGNGPAFASAMRRLADQNLAEADPERWVEVLLYSHPALSRRIAMAEAYTREKSS